MNTKRGTGFCEEKHPFTSPHLCYILVMVICYRLQEINSNIYMNGANITSSKDVMIIYHS